MAKSNEPIWWSLFGAGGVVGAMLAPITMVLTGIAVPMGLLTEGRLWNLLHHPLTKLYLLALIIFPLFHGAHRTLFTLIDIGLKPMRRALAFLLYGGAIVGSAVAVWLILVRL